MDLIRAELPALVVTDLHMPGVDGLRVARCARQQTPPIPVVLMTAYPPSGMTREAQALGGTVYLAKPFANADLLDAVRSALGPKTAE
jgi:CheY-like chemotaxis protein